MFSGAFPDPSVLDRASAVFTELIAEQKASGAAAGDHFATPGANDRVWGALDKLALRAPEVFADYYANDVLALVSEAWLGPGYQVTSQVNVVNPGGQAQVAHRDYHLGFMSLDQSLAYPAHVHRLSPLMTLQGAVAHCDMPVETGPTMYLPHSQKYAAGYVAFHQPEFTGYFDRHHVQLPLAKGDAAFFNPALFHGAGTNRSADVRRMANLLQVSSAFGRAMESVDRVAMSIALYPVLARRKAGRRGRAGAAQRRRRVGGGLRVPHQPRPRPAGRRAGTADPGGAGLAGAPGRLGHRDVRRRPARAHRPAPDEPGLTDPADSRRSAVGRGRHSDNRRQPPRPRRVMHRTLPGRRRGSRLRDFTAVSRKERPMTSRLNPYISFDGDARQAMEFYEQVFGGTLHMNTFGEYGMADSPDADKIMHAMLETSSGFTLMGADTPSGMTYEPGKRISVSLSGDDGDELRGYWEKLSASGTVSHAAGEADVGRRVRHVHGRVSASTGW